MSAKNYTHTEIDQYNRIHINGKPFFPIGFSPGPEAGTKTPDGRDALDELVPAGINFSRLGNWYREWKPEMDPALDRQLQWFSDHGIYSATNLQKFSYVGEKTGPEADFLREVVAHYSEYPATAFWKHMDEPQWGNVPLQEVRTGYEIIHETDPANRPVWVNHAPRGTIESLRRYSRWCEITGMDIYPVSNPIGLHSRLKNRQISTVGDHVLRMRQVVHDRKPLLFVLQIAWSGTLKKAPPMLWPTPHEERFMVYQAIITGSRALLFFGPALGLEGRDKELGWNWTFWFDVLKPIIQEIGPGSELYPVLTGIPTDEKVEVTSAGQMDVLTRSVGDKLYILADKREGETVETSFRLPDGCKPEVTVLYENRKLIAKNGVFTDRFAPLDVHVYRVQTR